MHIMATELGWKGPVAPGVVPKGCSDPHGAPLFAEITERPIASASLGQVPFIACLLARLRFDVHSFGRKPCHE